VSPLETAKHWIHEPKQSRSKDTSRRILEAAESLLMERGSFAAPVAEIVERAGVSVGGFYARFPNKRALLHAFDEYLGEMLLERAFAEMAPERWQGASVCAVVGAYIEMAADIFVQHREVMKQVALRARSGEEPEFLQRVQRVNRAAHGCLVELLLARREQISHPDPEQAATFGVMLVSAGLREMLLFGERKLNLSEVAGRKLLRELTRAYCAYLGATFEPLPPGEKTGSSK
jgi:AcrR family transcriptional regulator